MLQFEGASTATQDGDARYQSERRGASSTAGTHTFGEDAAVSDTGTLTVGTYAP